MFSQVAPFLEVAPSIFLVSRATKVLRKDWQHDLWKNRRHDLRQEIIGATYEKTLAARLKIFLSAWLTIKV